MPFTKKTFEYFDGAKKNINKKAWFEKNQDIYLEHVKAPLSELMTLIKAKCGKKLPGIDINPTKITRPLRFGTRAIDKGIVKTDTFISLNEKKTSFFEWNPGFYLQLGAAPDDNFVGSGLYMLSSRQTSLMRDALVNDFQTIDKILKNPKLKKNWGELAGEKYVRFPKGFNPESSAAKYLWHKQFYFAKPYTRKQVISKDFMNNVIYDINTSVEFLSWVRHVVGKYKKGG